ncbi:MAG: hypothetical protein EOP04_03300 [Proteobacteria bacterium]|nr:MAG: hypothetical protein EOP04_03300 [Pseudomonadota bacterium]
MDTQGNVLTLSSAATHAGVTVNTMREWAKAIPGTTRNDRGGYEIPKQSLMEFLATRQRRFAGASRGEVPPQMNPQSPPQPTAQVPAEGAISYFAEKVVSGLESERARLIAQVEGEKELRVGFQARTKELEAQIDRLNADLRERSNDVSKLSRQLMAVTLQLAEPRREQNEAQARRFEGEVVDAEHHDNEPSVSVASESKPAKPVVSKAKTKSKSSVKAKTKGKSKANTAKKKVGKAKR